MGHDPKLIQFSRELVQKVLNGHNADSTLLGEAMVIAARNGDAALYEEFMKRVQNPKSPEDYLRFFKTLGYSQQPELIQRTLQYAVSPQVRTQDALFVFGSLMSDPSGRKPAWDFIRQHWTEVKAKMPEADIGFFVEGARSFCDNESRDQVQQFFTEHPIPAAQRALQRTLETISNCVDTRTQQQASLAASLEKQPTGAKGKEQQSVVPGAAAGSR